MDYHIMAQSRDKKTIDVVLHIAVPSVNNSAGVNYRTALRAYLESRTETGVITSDYPNISAGELTQMQAGEVYERSFAYRFSVLGLSAGQKQTELDTFYAAEKSTFLQEAQDILEWWGYDRNVP